MALFHLHHSNLFSTRLRRQQSRFPCCNGTIATIDPSSSQSAIANTTTTGEDLQFLTCSIDSDTSAWDPLSTESSPYLDYQNCLLRQGSEHSKCNMPNGETVDDCPVGMRTAPAGDGKVTCAAENRSNATSVLSRCCGSELGVYGYGCYAWCEGGGELQDCIADNQERESGPAIFCQNTNGSSNGDSGNEGDSSDGTSGSGATRAAKKTAVLVYALSALLLKEMLF
jgi:hypothetical protein